MKDFIYGCYDIEDPSKTMGYKLKDLYLPIKFYPEGVIVKVFDLFIRFLKPNVFAVMVNDIIFYSPNYNLLYYKKKGEDWNEDNRFIQEYTMKPAKNDLDLWADCIIKITSKVK